MTPAISRRLNALIEQHGGSLVKASQRLGVTPQVLCRIRKGDKPIPEWLALEMGLKRRKVVEYVYEDIEP